MECPWGKSRSGSWDADSMRGNPRAGITTGRYARDRRKTELAGRTVQIRAVEPAGKMVQTRAAERTGTAVTAAVEGMAAIMEAIMADKSRKSRNSERDPDSCFLLKFVGFYVKVFK